MFSHGLYNIIVSNDLVWFGFNVSLNTIIYNTRYVPTATYIYLYLFTILYTVMCNV